jgi:hypothetical protein
MARKNTTTTRYYYYIDLDLVMQLRIPYGTGPRPCIYSHFRTLYRNRIRHVPTKEE